MIHSADVPRGTMKNLVRILLFSVLFLFGCEKPNPNPELSDPIYLDLKTQTEELSKAVESEKKGLQEHLDNLKKAVPQTGQIKFAQKRVNDAKEKIQKLEQEYRWFEVRTESRKSFAKKEYMSAWRKKQPWPDPKEFEEYKKMKEMRSIPLSWSLKKRYKDLGIPDPSIKAKPVAPAGGGHGEAPPAAEAHH